MKYGLTKKLTFLLLEQYNTREDNTELENDIMKVVDELEENEFYDLRVNFEECISTLKSKIIVRYEFEPKPFEDINTFQEFKKWLVDYSCHLSEEQCLREMEAGICRAEKFREDYCENGFDFMTMGGF